MANLFERVHGRAVPSEPMILTIGVEDDAGVMQKVFELRGGEVTADWKRIVELKDMWLKGQIPERMDGATVGVLAAIWLAKNT